MFKLFIMDGFFYTQEFYMSVGLGIVGLVFLVFLIFLIFKKPKPNKFDPVKPKNISSNKNIEKNSIINNRTNILQAPKKYQRNSFR